MVAVTKVAPGVSGQDGAALVSGPTSGRGRCRCGQPRTAKTIGGKLVWFCKGCSKAVADCSCEKIAKAAKPSSSIIASEMGKRSAAKVPKSKMKARMSALGKASGVVRAVKPTNSLSIVIGDLRKQRDKIQAAIDVLEGLDIP